MNWTKYELRAVAPCPEARSSLPSKVTHAGLRGAPRGRPSFGTFLAFGVCVWYLSLKIRWRKVGPCRSPRSTGFQPQADARDRALGRAWVELATLKDVAGSWGTCALEAGATALGLRSGPRSTGRPVPPSPAAFFHNAGDTYRKATLTRPKPCRTAIQIGTTHGEWLSGHRNVRHLSANKTLPPGSLWRPRRHGEIQ